MPLRRCCCVCCCVAGAAMHWLLLRLPPTACAGPAAAPPALRLVCMVRRCQCGRDSCAGGLVAHAGGSLRSEGASWGAWPGVQGHAMTGQRGAGLWRGPPLPTLAARPPLQRAPRPGWCSPRCAVEARSALHRTRSQVLSSRAAFTHVRARSARSGRVRARGRGPGELCADSVVCMRCAVSSDKGRGGQERSARRTRMRAAGPLGARSAPGARVSRQAVRGGQQGALARSVGCRAAARCGRRGGRNRVTRTAGGRGRGWDEGETGWLS